MRLLSAICAVLLAAGFAFAQEPMRLDVELEPLRIVAPDGTERARFSIELAEEDDERRRGLMFRTDLADDRGMLFDFGGSRVVNMWMMNTPLPLDMVFAEETGAVTTIAKDTTPFSRDIVSSETPAAYVLEINAGLADRFGIAPGDCVLHPAVASGCGR